LEGKLNQSTRVRNAMFLILINYLMSWSANTKFIVEAKQYCAGCICFVRPITSSLSCTQ
jgi:hypothetical protein